ncbi:hypothetical protein ACIBO2_27410 [Nonomuraea sp. NPDC050022]|uniref:hypothetical protein n=1 Tax=unclassified Nonomuraea TaxID=2593643 RepID=UPI0033E25E86
MSIMGVRFIYFSGVREEITPELIEDGPSEVAGVGGPEPSVALGQLGQHLTGVSFLEIGDSVKSWPGQVDVPDDPDEREMFFYDHGIDPEATPEELEVALNDLRWGLSVVELKDQLRDALAAVPADDYRRVAEQWAAIEELRGLSVDEVLTVLGRLCSLARQAVGQKQHLYCWVML